MKIKVAIYDSDIEYMNRLAKIFQQKYTDKVALLIFSSFDMMYKNLNENQVDVVLVNQSVKPDSKMLPDGVIVGYLSTVPDIDEIEGIPAICKYQKAEEIYKQILNLYAENTSEIKLKKSAGDKRFLLFTSVQGGSGTSTAAAAYAMRRAVKKKIFYLNMERFGDSNLYFHGDGKLSFSDVIYALKSRKGNLGMKLESAAQTDLSGVDFFRSCGNAYDMFELSDDDICYLIQGILQIAKYEEIVIDISGDMTERMLMLMRDYADRIVYVADGSLVGNGKFERFCEVIRVMEQRENYRILEKTCLLYNRYSSKNSQQLEMAAIPVIGGLHRFEGIRGKELCEKIASIDLLDQI